MSVDIKAMLTRGCMAVLKMKPFLNVWQEEAKRVTSGYWTNESETGSYEKLVSMELQLGGKPLPRHSLVREMREVWIDALPLVSCIKGSTDLCRYQSGLVLVGVVLALARCQEHHCSQSCLEYIRGTYIDSELKSLSCWWQRPSLWLDMSRMSHRHVFASLLIAPESQIHWLVSMIGSLPVRFQVSAFRLPFEMCR